MLAHRPRKDIYPNILEAIVEVSATSSDSGNPAHAKRHYDVKYVASVRKSVDNNKKLSAGRLHDHCNAISQKFGMPTASVSTLKGDASLLVLGTKTAGITPMKQRLSLVKFPIWAQTFPLSTYSIVGHLSKCNNESLFASMNDFLIYEIIPLSIARMQRHQSYWDQRTPSTRDVPG